jgi:TM2 domain-containing membrane protein YozV
LSRVSQLMPSVRRTAWTSTNDPLYARFAVPTAMMAIALSVIFPGLGQLYYGKWGRAILMMLVGVTPLYPAALVWSVLDAYRLGQRGLRPQFSRGDAVLAIVLLVVVAPLCIALLVVTGGEALGWFQDAHLNRSATVAEGAEIAATIIDYRSELGHYPDSLSTIVGTRPLRAGWFTDGWGRPYRYQVEETGKSFKLTSAGRDGKFETDDDLAWRP